MNKLEKVKLKQLNHLAKAIDNLTKALQLGEQLGDTNGDLAGALETIVSYSFIWESEFRTRSNTAVVSDE